MEILVLIQKDIATLNVAFIQTLYHTGIMPLYKEHSMKHKLLLSLLATGLLASSSLQAANSMNAQAPSQKMMKKGNKKAASPFLITVGLPHMTKLVKQNWNNPELNLTAEQKEKLLVVRKATMSGVKAVKPQIMQLQQKIKQMTMSGADISKIAPLIDQVAVLKADASKVHVKCIHDTKNILTQKQVSYLLGR